MPIKKINYKEILNKLREIEYHKDDARISRFKMKSEDAIKLLKEIHAN